MSDSLTIPKEEYDMLKCKADLFDYYIETEMLSNADLKQVKDALNGLLMTKKEFLKRHPYLS